jgi:hypothetical protein
MRGTGIEKAVEICATNITNKTECTSTHAKKWETFLKTCSNTTSDICGVKPEHLRLKGPNWVGVFSPIFTWGRKQIQFPKRHVL